jgi:hypothetical protein
MLRYVQVIAIVLAFVLAAATPAVASGGYITAASVMFSISFCLALVWNFADDTLANRKGPLLALYAADVFMSTVIVGAGASVGAVMDLIVRTLF